MNPLSNTQYCTHLLMSTQSSVLLFTILLIFSTLLEEHEELDCYSAHTKLSPPLQFPIFSSFYKQSDSTSNSNPMLSVNIHLTILSPKYPSIATMNGIHNRITFDAKKVRPSHPPIQHYLSPPSSPSISFSPSFQCSQDLSFNTVMPSFNQNIFDPTTMSKHYTNTPVPYAPRLYNPLQHQQGIWSYTRLHQYYTLYPDISSNNSTSISPGNHFLYSLYLSPILSPLFQTRKR